MQASSDPLDPRAVLCAVDVLRIGTKKRLLARTKELPDMRSKR
jgi:hypothetical protein